MLGIEVHVVIQPVDHLPERLALEVTEVGIRRVVAEDLPVEAGVEVGKA